MADAASCRELLERYSELVDHRLPGSEAMRLWAHVRRCPSCRRYHGVVHTGASVLRDMPEPEASPDFHERLRERLEREDAGRVGGRRPVLLTLALVVLVVVWGVSHARADRVADPDGASVVLTARRSSVTDLEAVGLPRSGDGWTGLAAPSWQWIPADAPSPTLAMPASRSYSPLIVGPPIFRAADWRRRTSGAEPLFSD